MSVIDKLDHLLSEYVRRSSADHAGFAECFTCGVKRPWQHMDAGHFVRRANTGARFDEANVRCQCPTCNRLRDGMPETFEEELRVEIGDEKVDALLQNTYEPKKMTADYLQGLVIHYRRLVRELGG